MFIKKSKIVHGDKYDYSLVDYKNAKTKIKIICKKHDVFEQRPNDNLNGHGCPYCSNNKKLTNKDFIKKSEKIHGYKYDYSLVEYKNNSTKVKIICNDHGMFEQRPTGHLVGKGCPYCKGGVLLNNNLFIEKSKKIHNDRYDYSLIDYKNAKTKVKIICKIHSVFEQRPYRHLSGDGCPVCKESKGEKEIRILLEQKEIRYEIQKKFNDCKSVKILPFDFYLPDYNTCIEYDGIQHYKPIIFFGGEKGLNELKVRDKIKTIFCKKNNINIIRIKYNENILEKINSIFNI